MNENDLQNINQIDMECQYFDDNDTFNIKDTEIATDDREVQSKTGIIINFDDDEDYRPVKKITANISNKSKNIDIQSNFLDKDFHDYNEIDMETPYSEDDEMLPKSITKNTSFFDDEDEISGLIDDDILEESKSKKKITFGEVEDDYWDKLSKKHTKTNKKGAYNTSFHFAGNPKKEQDMFNHMINTDSANVDVADLVGEDSLLATGLAATGDIGNAEFDAEVGEISGGEGCSESLSKSGYSSKLLQLFDIIGFEVFKNSDGSYVAIDTCDILPSINCSDFNSLISTLKPYIDDCLIYPLQFATAQKFDNYKDWVTWYNKDNKKQFPKCSQDIDFCDLLANHLHECVID